ncbi:MAG: hypothetical protein PHO41_07605 [Eubacteriales bacterium]|nr:hypothetical protein [Eubacteriales bacterium]
MKTRRIVFFVLAALCAVAAIVMLIGGESAGIGGLLACALFVWLALRKPKAKPKASAQRRRAAAPVAYEGDDPDDWQYDPDECPDDEDVPGYVPGDAFYSFSVVGTRYNNADGSSRQAALQQAQHTRHAARAVDVRPYDYKGERAYAVLLNGSCIGNVARNDITDYEAAQRAGLRPARINIRQHSNGLYYADVRMEA